MMRHFTKSILIMQIFYSNSCSRYPTRTECIIDVQGSLDRGCNHSEKKTVVTSGGNGGARIGLSACEYSSSHFSEILWAKASMSHQVLRFKPFQLLEGKKGSILLDINRCLLDLLLTKATFSYTNMLTKVVVTVLLDVKWRVSHFM